MQLTPRIFNFRNLYRYHRTLAQNGISCHEPQISQPSEYLDMICRSVTKFDKGERSRDLAYH